MGVLISESAAAAAALLQVMPDMPLPSVGTWYIA